ncbi:protein PYRICULARIA ORYZAE RESISTANCE 21-like [Olea europaea var. sylvestris]|uniref:protein PYRICULARIA ORYZAE RESISTANCE 21-like n=1 Tax=Olea europaea var. sylvestris TaxID=158386 RepID=UPI000C1D3D14|nr:protein PYRICULARIA ORYZAE RESISTANCE 21-like [Olea europaea var. sylvestris]
MAETVTEMVLKVDLQCTSCYKKIKKILCKFPEIRGQTYDVKQNTVTISVVCCSPEKFRDKLCCKGGKVIQCIVYCNNTAPAPAQVHAKDLLWTMFFWLPSSAAVLRRSLLLRLWV